MVRRQRSRRGRGVASGSDPEVCRCDHCGLHINVLTATPSLRPGLDSAGVAIPPSSTANDLLPSDKAPRRSSRTEACEVPVVRGRRPLLRPPAPARAPIPSGRAGNGDHFVGNSSVRSGGRIRRRRTWELRRLLMRSSTSALSNADCHRSRW